MHEAQCRTNLGAICGSDGKGKQTGVLGSILQSNRRESRCVTFDGLGDTSSDRVELHGSLDSESARGVVWQNTDQDEPLTIARGSVVDDLSSLESCVSIKDLCRRRTTSHGVPMGDTAVHDETDLRLVYPFPVNDILVGHIRR